MKRLIYIIFLAILVVSFLESAYVGKIYFKQLPGEPPQRIFKVPESFLKSRYFNDHVHGKADIKRRTEKAADTIFEDQLTELQAYFQSEVKRGNLRIRLVQEDHEAMMEHYRYTQYYKDLEVFGGEIIEHFKEGKLVGINGEYYEIEDFDIIPLITKDLAVELFRADLGKSNLVEKAENSKLIIYPVKDGEYHLAYHIVLREEVGYSMSGIIDARTGEVLLKYSNIKTDDLTIGFGYGYHGENYKFPTIYQNSKYLLADEKRVRPVNQYTYDFRTYDGKFYYVAWDADNYWDYDGALISAHTFLGFTYDYYYLVNGRKGIDNRNLDIIATIHWYDGKDNAYWDGDKDQMYFLDPGQNGFQFAGTLDVVAHEYSHGVTDYTSDLIYWFESGALNESFSDIMGTAVEFYWQDAGNGLLKADWLVGEDAKQYFNTSGCRNLADPNSNSQFGDPRYPDPCHLSQVYIWPSYIDAGGVHLNCTLYAHAYYLLANGGTNKISKKSVNGIGIEKATKIFYRAWSYWMTPTSNFWNAANYLLWSAQGLYGSSSNEYTQTIKAMEAIGWTVN